MPDRPLHRLSLDETDEIFPDVPHYGGTVETLLLNFRIDSTERVFALEAVAVAEVEPSYDDWHDPNADLAKVESLRRAIRRGGHVPPVYAIHMPSEAARPYYVYEGVHRFAAHRLEGRQSIVAWVAHKDCCSGES